MNRSARHKAAKWVFAALEYVPAVFPFPIIGIGIGFISGDESPSRRYRTEATGLCIDSKEGSASRRRVSRPASFSK